MTPISLMPPLDYCPSCEGRKAEAQALQVGEARAERAASELGLDPGATAAPAAPPALEAGAVAGRNDGAKPVAGAIPPLLAPDLAVQASLAGSGIDQGGGAEALRLLSTVAYRGS